MFDRSIDDRLSAWASFRANLALSSDPLQDVHDFWKTAPFVPVNNRVDPYNQSKWPSPWEIIVHNKYDDFTKALMIGWTLKYTKLYENASIVLKTVLDKNKNIAYNTICVDSEWVINYNDNAPVFMLDIENVFYLENVIELSIPR